MKDEFFRDYDGKDFVPVFFGLFSAILGFFAIENSLFSNFAAGIGVAVAIISFLRFLVENNQYSENPKLVKYTGLSLVILSILAIFTLEYLVTDYLTTKIRFLPVGPTLAIISILVGLCLLIFHTGTLKDFQPYFYKISKFKKDEESSTEIGEELGQKLHDMAHYLIDDLPEESRAKGIEQKMDSRGEAEISDRKLILMALAIFGIFGAFILIVSILVPSGFFIAIFSVFTLELVRFWFVRYGVIDLGEAITTGNYTLILIVTILIIFLVTKYSGLPI